MKQYNILFLGETGTGKSTFVNAFGNFASYETLDEAKNGHLITLVGTSYTIHDFNDDGEFDDITIKACNDDDESNDAGVSSTQKCKTHLFSIDDESLVRIIDTPGVADTRGVEQDKLNFQNIIKSINMNKNLHAVCIVLKANQTRITEHFSNCLRQLLSQLHKSVIKNIIFVFTHGKSVNYNLGPPLRVLKQFLENVKKESPNIEIKINKDNAYCFENDSFNYLLSLRENKNVDDCNFGESWNKSRDECVRMLKYIMALSPHDAHDTLYLNKTRQLLENILKPISSTIEIIDVNLLLIVKHQKELETVNNNIENLRKLMETPSIELETKKLKKPNFVCKSETCRATYNVEGISKVYYPQICCSECGYWKHYFSHEEFVKFESRSYMGSTFCSKCECKAADHDLVYSQTNVVRKRRSNEAVYGEITSTEKLKEVKQQMLQKDKLECKTYEKERDVIIKSVAKFSVFLQKNSISSFKDVFAENINAAITNALKENNFEKFESLENTLKLYETEKEKIHVINYSIQDMTRVLEKLCSLELTGKQINEIYSIMEEELSQKTSEENNKNRIPFRKFFSKRFGSKK